MQHGSYDDNQQASKQEMVDVSWHEQSDCDYLRLRLTIYLFTMSKSQMAAPPSSLSSES